MNDLCYILGVMHPMVGIVRYENGTTKSVYVK